MSSIETIDTNVSEINQNDIICEDNNKNEIISLELESNGFVPHTEAERENNLTLLGSTDDDADYDESNVAQEMNVTSLKVVFETLPDIPVIKETKKNWWIEQIGDQEYISNLKDPTKKIRKSARKTSAPGSLSILLESQSTSSNQHQNTISSDNTIIINSNDYLQT